HRVGAARGALDGLRAVVKNLRAVSRVIEPAVVAVKGLGVKSVARDAGQRPQPLAPVAPPTRFAREARAGFRARDLEVDRVEVGSRRRASIAPHGPVTLACNDACGFPGFDSPEPPL